MLRAAVRSSTVTAVPSSEPESVSSTVPELRTSTGYIAVLRLELFLVMLDHPQGHNVY